MELQGRTLKAGMIEVVVGFGVWLVGWGGILHYFILFYSTRLFFFFFFFVALLLNPIHDVSH